MDVNWYPCGTEPCGDKGIAVKNLDRITGLIMSEALAHGGDFTLRHIGFKAAHDCSECAKKRWPGC